MAGESGGEENAYLERTPTWAVATVCFFLISISILLEHGLHLLAKYLGRKRRKSLLEALNKIKSDLLLLGFISFSLVMLEKPIATICIPISAAESFLPCQSLTTDEEEEPKCEENGKMSLMWRASVQELQVLIFFLAFFHVLSSLLLTFSLGAAEIRGGSNSFIKPRLEGGILDIGVNTDCCVCRLIFFDSSLDPSTK